jgi:hypothetical protein
VHLKSGMDLLGGEVQGWGGAGGGGGAIFHDKVKNYLRQNEIQ